MTLSVEAATQPLPKIPPTWFFSSLATMHLGILRGGRLLEGCWKWPINPDVRQTKYLGVQYCCRGPRVRRVPQRLLPLAQILQRQICCHKNRSNIKTLRRAIVSAAVVAFLLHRTLARTWTV